MTDPKMCRIKSASTTIPGSMNQSHSPRSLPSFNQNAEEYMDNSPASVFGKQMSSFASDNEILMDDLVQEMHTPMAAEHGQMGISKKEMNVQSVSVASPSIPYGDRMVSFVSVESDYDITVGHVITPNEGVQDDNTNIVGGIDRDEFVIEEENVTDFGDADEFVICGDSTLDGAINNLTQRNKTAGY